MARSSQFWRNYVLMIVGFVTTALLLHHNPAGSSLRVSQFEADASQCLEADSLLPYTTGPEEFVATYQGANLLCAQAKVAYDQLNEREKQRVSEGLMIAYLVSGRVGTLPPDMKPQERDTILSIYAQLRPTLRQRMKIQQTLGTRQAIVRSFFFCPRKKRCFPSTAFFFPVYFMICTGG